MVFLLKVVLPILALGLLGTMFLFSRPREAVQGIESTEPQIVQLIRRVGIGKPQFSGKTAAGSVVRVSASSLRQRAGDDRLLDALNISARVVAPNDEVFTAAAGKAVVNRDAMQAMLSGGVTFRTNTGLEITTDGAQVSLTRVEARTTGPIHATGPLGEISAGQMELSEGARSVGGGGNRGYVLVFKGGVKLIYRSGS